jgi:hypothetical protein
MAPQVAGAPRQILVPAKLIVELDGHDWASGSRLPASSFQLTTDS